MSTPVSVAEFTAVADRIISSVGDSELASLRRQFQSLREQAAELTAGLAEDQFNWRPAPGEWSIEECIAHLVMIGQTQARLIGEAIEEGRARGYTGTGPFQYSQIERYIVSLTEPPARIPLPAPPRFRPSHGQPLTAIMPAFDHVLTQFLGLVDRAEGLDLARVKVAVPLTSLFKFSLGMTLQQVAAHNRRHLEQARRVRSRLPARAAR